MDDLISRKMAVELFPDDDLESDTKGGYIAPHLARQMISELTSSQPTLYGYKIEHLVFIAKAMEKDGLSPEEVGNFLRDTGYAVKLVIESLK